ncbi:Translin-1 [Podospora pseudopauciseta]|uniref:Translin-1 n=2 Tax=Podospora TaxID=5144 RepID=A0ABR0HMQ2_9PEZI|nr:Translin-1 [Podospora pseudopauciseta]KAK4679246.1 Translin-1 [Podospora pseudoanserina]
MPPMIDPSLFDQIKSKIEEDTTVRKELEQIVDELHQHVSFTQGLLSKIHSTPRSKYATLLPQVEEGIKSQVATVGKLSAFASQYPYYKYNHKWTRPLQDSLSTCLLFTWLSTHTLLTPLQLATYYSVPLNLTAQDDAFHITTEEYLLALVSIIDDLSRLAMNSVTLGDTALAVEISAFIRDLHAGFQVLNLKNDILRKRVDSIKYAVKKVEDVVYDLSLRGLIPAVGAEDEKKGE